MGLFTGNLKIPVVTFLPFQFTSLGFAIFVEIIFILIKIIKPTWF